MDSRRKVYVSKDPKNYYEVQIDRLRRKLNDTKPDTHYYHTLWGKLDSIVGKLAEITGFHKDCPYLVSVEE